MQTFKMQCRNNFLLAETVLTKTNCMMTLQYYLHMMYLLKPFLISCPLRSSRPAQVEKLRPGYMYVGSLRKIVPIQQSIQITRPKTPSRIGRTQYVISHQCSKTMWIYEIDVLQKSSHREQMFYVRIESEGVWNFVMHSLLDNGCPKHALQIPNKNSQAIVYRWLFLIINTKPSIIIKG